MPERSVLIVSLREVVHEPAYAMIYEFEDMVARWENADLHSVGRFHGDRRFDRRRMAFKTLRLGGLSSDSAMRLLQPRPAPPDKHYDIVLFCAATSFDLFVLDELPWIREIAGSVVVFVAEAWEPTVTNRALLLEPWEMVDLACCAIRPSAALLDGVLPCPVVHVPLGVDTLSFAPDLLRSRPVDVYNPGRRHDLQHQRLSEASAACQGWYLFDTLGGGSMSDHRDHRRQYASLLTRTSTVICNHAKFDSPETTGDFRVAPGRLLEALAAGCRVVGTGVDSAAMSDLGLDLQPPAQLSFDPTLQEACDAFAPVDTAERQRNAEAARASLDWGHRWAAILGALDAPPGPALSAHIQSLRAG